MDNGGFIVVYRDILQWEWYTDVNTAHLFIHCILKANHADANWRGIEIKRGSFITSLQKLSTETGLTVKQVRNSLEKLEKTGEVANCSTSKYRIITVKNYDVYQNEGKQEGKLRANKRASKGQGEGKVRATNNNNNNKNNENKGVGVCAVGTNTPTPPEKEKEAALTTVSPQMGATVEPLTVREWRTYCELKGQDEYKADEVWRKCNGHFSEKSILQVRECLKNG